MNSKIKTLLGALVGAIVMFFAKEYFPNTGDDFLNAPDSVIYTPIIQASVDTSVYIDIIDNLKTELAKKPKIEVRYVPKPFPVIIKKDSIITKEVPIKIIEVKYDTLYIENPLADPKFDSKYGAESIIYGSSDRITLRLRTKELGDKDILYLYNGEDVSKSLAVHYTKESIKRRIKLNTSSVYSLLVSNEEGVEERLNKLIKNKNKF